VLRVEAGDLVRQFPEALKLCAACSERFADLIRSGSHANQAVAPGPIPTVLEGLPIPTAETV
jgi:hypothetical protein